MLMRLVILLAVLSTGSAKNDTLAQTSNAPVPKPVIFDDGSGDPFTTQDSFLPMASFPIFESDGTGHRNLEDVHLPQAEETHKSNQGGKENFDHFDNVTDAVPRSLSEDCFITNTILGLRYDDNFGENGVKFTPADSHGAVGSFRLVSAVNSMLEVRQKDGTLRFRDGFQSFFSSIAQASDTNFFFNPKVIYDEHQGRFLVLVLQRSTSPQISRIWLAVSTSETPDGTNAWKKLYIDAALPIDGFKTFADFPGFEVDEEAVYITNNMYRFADGQYAGVRLWWFSKGLYDGFYAGLPFSTFITNPFVNTGVAPTTTMPAQVHGYFGADGSVGTYLVSAIVYFNGEVCLQVYTLFNPLFGPSASSQPICLGTITQGYEMPLAPQYGTNVPLATNNAQILDVVLRDYKLWVIFTINPRGGVNQGQATAHWVRLGAYGGTIVLEQQGNLGGEDIAPGAFTYYPSVAVNSQGLAAFGYSASSFYTYAGSYASVGTSGQSYTLKSGMAPYVRLNDFGQNRWGDYSSISVDVSDDSFWIFNQYADTPGSADAGGNGRWATAWSRLVCFPTFTDEPTPTPPPTRPPTRRPTRRPTRPPTRPPVAPTNSCPITWKLYNSNTNAAVAVLTNGLYVANPPPCGKTSIEVVVPCLGQSDMVVMDLYRGSKLVRRQTESQKPFFLFGDDSKGDVKDGKIAAGSYGVRVKVNNVWSPFTYFTLGGTCS